MDSSKSPFDSSQPSGESAANESASATGMFGKVVPQPAPSPEQDDLLQSLLRADAPGRSSIPATPQQPPVQAPPQTASPGSFTQMFQALKPAEEQPVQAGNPPQVPPAPPTPIAPPKPAADLTSVFTPVSINKPLAPAASPAPPPFPVGQKPGEFTQLLQTLKEQSAPQPPPVAETTQNPAEPGSITQVFKAASPQPVTAETEFAPVHVPEATPIPSQPVAPTAPALPPMAAPITAPAQAPGAFTQMFQTLSPAKPTAETPAPVPVQPIPAQPVPVTSAAPPQPAATGGFTQMFQSLSSAKEPAPVSAQPAPAFEPPTAPKSGPGSFTQMFSQIGGQNTPQEDPLASLQQQPPPSSNFQFSTPAPPSSNSPFGNTPPPAPTPSAQGGFTQLFQALGKEETVPAKEPPPLMPLAPATAASGPPAVGGFTQLLRTLNTEPSPQPAQAAPLPLAPVPAAPRPLSGPGEFTRIISGSMVREAQGQNVVPGSPPVMPPAGQAAGGQPAFQMPPAPAFPKIPTAPPPMPSPMPQMHAGGAGGAPQMPHFQPPTFQFPPAAPPAAPQPPPPGKLQQYLPLILIVNVFVLIVVILIVVFALRHH